jgi:hypothetical protein
MYDHRGGEQFRHRACKAKYDHDRYANGISRARKLERQRKKAAREPA